VVPAQKLPTEKQTLRATTHAAAGASSTVSSTEAFAEGIGGS
jgi:hypothetical protein